MSLGPVVAGAALAEHKVVGPENLPEGTGPDAVHGAGLKIDQDGPGNVPRVEVRPFYKDGCYISSINPFLPTGQFMAPKLIILIKCLIDILSFKVLF